MTSDFEKQAGQTADMVVQAIKQHTSKLLGHDTSGFEWDSLALAELHELLAAELLRRRGAIHHLRRVIGDNETRDAFIAGYWLSANASHRVHLKQVQKMIKELEEAVEQEEEQ